MNDSLSFAQACEFLSVSTSELNDLRENGLVICHMRGGKQIYLRTPLAIARYLLDLGRERDWIYETLACYADLAFAAEVGRAVLLPMNDENRPSSPASASWLETHYAEAVLHDLDASIEAPEGTLVALLRAVVAVAVGPGQFWEDKTALESSALYPVLQHFEAQNVPILGQAETIARDASLIFSTILLAFATVAPPIAPQFREMALHTYSKLRANAEEGISVEERALILRESQIAVDKLYASKATEIHSPAEFENISVGVMRAEKRTIALELKNPPETPQEVIDNIIDLVGPYLGVFGSRVLRVLYEVSNDGPYWRTPVITVSSNELLDRLGLERDKRGYHRSDSRERLRDALAAAHNLEIVGEVDSWEDGKRVRKGFRRTVLSLIGATFEADGTQGMSMADLFHRGLPKSMQIRLNFFDGVRRPDGKLGDKYVLLPRLAAPEILPSARHVTTEERLKAYFLLRYRQTEDRVLTITRKLALENAGITNSNASQATRTLVHALDKLVRDGILEIYTTVPRKPNESFSVTLASL